MKSTQFFFTIFFFIFTLLRSISATEPMVVSLEDFLNSFRRTFRNEPYNFTPIRAYSENLVTVHLKFPNPGNSTLDLPDLISLMTGETVEEVKTIIVDDPGCLLMERGIFPPETNVQVKKQHSSIKMKKASNGSHPVGIYKCGGNKLCFKQCPEAPGVEIVTHAIFQTIFGKNNENTPIPPAAVILINRKFFLVSQFMGEKSFEKILTKHPLREYVFNLERFQRLAIFSLLTVPEDCGPRNCRVSLIPNSSEHEFILIDNERSFGKEFTGLDEEGRQTRCHCVLFCFDELFKYKIKESVFNEIISKKHEILATWTKILREDSYQKGLTQYIGERAEEKTFLGLPLDKDILIRMISKLNDFVNLMRLRREESLANIFRIISPKLAEIYNIQASYPLPEVAAAAISLTTILERLHMRDPGRGPGCPTPTSALTPIGSYLGTTRITLPGVLEVMTYVRDHCDALDERERKDASKVVDALTLARDTTNIFVTLASNNNLNSVLKSFFK